LKSVGVIFGFKGHLSQQDEYLLNNNSHKNLSGMFRQGIAPIIKSVSF
jgi:hypothetical protein